MPWNRKVDLFIGTGAWSLITVMTTWENQLEHWGKIQRTLEGTFSYHGHQTTTGHPTTPDNLSIVGREGQGFARTIKESIFIGVNNPTLKETLVSVPFLIFWMEF